MIKISGFKQGWQMTNLAWADTRNQHKNEARKKRDNRLKLIRRTFVLNERLPQRGIRYNSDTTDMQLVRSHKEINTITL